ncbi:MAG: hypothetical protein QN142_06480 [Armatimonadota bacterium]|nr:hypothetical protein [Armatimonadota bacterium]MDR5690431.1 hypothetical protein [Armatimonadota bacterium]MDR7387566.1 hypothetical protein [Armatimonadota bacterium]MDR7388888.1 hypothetical protein [Armatimonadota bacterium]MDR7391185.1 hypothetical protein [Armatimonadota bacterium]
MAANRGLLAADKRYLAGVIHQVWRACQGFVSVVMERGPEDAFFVLDELDEWAAAQRRRLSGRTARRPAGLSAQGLRVARELLDDVSTFCSAIGDMVARLRASPLSPDEVEEECLMIVDGFVAWTHRMATQLGLSRNLRPQVIWPLR